MALRYCFENPIKILQKSKIHDLAVVDTEGYEAYEWATPIYAQALERI